MLYVHVSQSRNLENIHASSSFSLKVYGYWNKPLINNWLLAYTSVNVSGKFNLACNTQDKTTLTFNSVPNFTKELPANKRKERLANSLMKEVKMPQLGHNLELQTIPLLFAFTYNYHHYGIFLHRAQSSVATVCWVTTQPAVVSHSRKLHCIILAHTKDNTQDFAILPDNQI